MVERSTFFYDADTGLEFVVTKLANGKCLAKSKPANGERWQNHKSRDGKIDVSHELQHHERRMKILKWMERTL